MKGMTDYSVGTKLKILLLQSKVNIV